MPLVSSGVEHGNLRELALARMKDMGTEVSFQTPPRQDPTGSEPLPSKPVPRGREKNCHDYNPQAGIRPRLFAEYSFLFCFFCGVVGGGHN